MSELTTAQNLANALEEGTLHEFPRYSIYGWDDESPCHDAAKELRRLDIENQALKNKTQNILNQLSKALRSVGATVPAPECKGTIESAMNTGFCIALSLIERELESFNNQFN